MLFSDTSDDKQKALIASHVNLGSMYKGYIKNEY
jgi:hypothetical protein